MATIDVLLATYNGARFLPEQLSSLGDQTYKDWRLVVRDDGSSDDTLAIIKRWAQDADVPVKIVEDGRKGIFLLQPQQTSDSNPISDDSARKGNE